MAHLRNGEFGRYTTLKEITTIGNTTNGKGSTKVQKPTRTMKISEHTYRLFIGHSKRYYDVEPYDLILENLLKCYDEHNQNKSWRDVNES